MRRAWMAVLGTVAAVLPAGCGTICNFAHGDPDIYGVCKKTWRSSRRPVRREGVGLERSAG